MNLYQEHILEFLKKSHGVDFSDYNPQMVGRRINKRVFATKSLDFENYFALIKKSPKELDFLLDVLTINVSRFFRDTLVFEYFEDVLAPHLIHQKTTENINSIRIWSAGCAFGEEAYSTAILMNEIIKKENSRIEVNIFATDIDKKTLKRAQQAHFSIDSIKTVKYGLLRKYFEEKNGNFELIPEIRKMVSFSYFDLLDKQNFSPPKSIYGSFDLILCRNVLIYFNLDAQKIIFQKLFHALNPGGYLFLGQAEMPIGSYRSQFKLVKESFHIYQKL